MSLQDAAFAAIDRGLVIFPIKPGGHMPLVTFSSRVAVTRDEAQRWWRTEKSRKNIGIRCGWSDSLNAYVVVIDIDKQSGGLESFVRLVQEHGPLPDTYAVTTPSGGFHLYFVSDKDIRNSASKIAPGVDVRGHNGFVIGAGSLRDETEKKAAGVYEASNDYDLAPMPDWLEEACLGEREQPQSDAHLTQPADAHDDEPLEDVPLGARNDRLFKEACGLRGKGWKADAILQAITARNNTFTQPLKNSEVELIASQAAKYAPNAPSLHDNPEFQKPKTRKATAKAPTERHPDEEAPRVIQPFKIIKSQELYEKEIAPLNYCVEPLLAEGMYLLNGRPKGGKSWLAMEIAAAVGEGNQLWGTYDTHQGDVLYLALEDGERRLKDRLHWFGNPHNLDLVTDDVERIDDGLQEQIEMWHEQATRPQLIVIDILQRVMGEKNSSSESVYKFDYNMAKAMQELAQRLRICMLIVHHTRKMITDHDMDSVSGSQGLAGAADGVWFLKSPNNGKTGRLTMFSRDTDSGEYDLVRADKPSGRWEFVGEHDDDHEAPTDVRIVSVLQADGASTVTQIAKVLGSARSHVQTTLTRMHAEGEVEREREGSANSPYVYCLPGPASEK